MLPFHRRADSVRERQLAPGAHFLPLSVHTLLSVNIHFAHILCLSADITAYDAAFRLQRETEVAARESTKASKGNVLKTKRKISNKRRADKGRSLEYSKRARTDFTYEQKEAKRLRERLRESKRDKRTRTRAYSPAQTAARVDQRRANKKQKFSAITRIY